MVIYDILYLLLDIHVNLLYKFFFVILIFFYFKKIHINFLSYSYNIVVRSNNCMLEKVRLARGKKRLVSQLRSIQSGSQAQTNSRKILRFSPIIKRLKEEKRHVLRPRHHYHQHRLLFETLLAFSSSLVSLVRLYLVNLFC